MALETVLLAVGPNDTNRIDELASTVVDIAGPAGAEVVVEPVGKDTGPALAYATHCIGERYGDDAVVVVLPSDHTVGDVARFTETLERGAGVARAADRLVAFGVDPTRPETGYGYIEPGREHDGLHAPHCLSSEDKNSGRKKSVRIRFVESCHQGIV